jgi:hypothetical protein|tara:strand:+ start:2265 stop:2495 length:231 start_codon:yes stop_codon:yes gene_type:complete
MAHVVISVSPETKDKLDTLRNNIEEEQGFKLSYSDVVKMLLKTYEQRVGTGMTEDSRQVEMDFDEGKSEILDRFKG